MLCWRRTDLYPLVDFFLNINEDVISLKHHVMYKEFHQITYLSKMPNKTVGKHIKENIDFVKHKRKTSSSNILPPIEQKVKP